MFKYVDMSDQSVALMPAAQLVQTDWSLPRAGEPGYVRTVCRGFIGAGASLGVGIMPVGQRSPLHTPNAEHLLLGLAGQLTWRVEGQEHVMDPMDLLFIGANREYEYWNSSFKEARFVDVIGRVDRWPHSTQYQ
jgi:quercetin dioxygenase-like cupin family protein